MAERIWYEDAAGMFTAANFGAVVPMPNTSFAQQLNAVVRLTVYYAVVMALFRQNLVYLAIPAAACLVTYALYTSRGPGRGVAGFSDAGPCRAPTKDNPFMNTSYVVPADAPPSCNPLDPAVRDAVDVQYAKGMYRDLDDVWGQRTAARHFITNPVTATPNDQAAFGEWLYGDMRRSGGKQVRPPGNSV